MLSTRVRWVERMLGAAIIARRCRKKIARLAKELKAADAPGLARAISRRFNGYSCDLWHRTYAAASGRQFIDYLPEDLFYNVFERRLNPGHRKAPYQDKNYFDRLGWSCLPQTIFRIINGRLFDDGYHMIDSTSALKRAWNSDLAEFVVKPARETGGGSRVSFLNLDELGTFLQTHLKTHDDWIVQRPIVQHEAMAQLHSTCINTLRIVTIRMGAEVSVVSAFARIGSGKTRVDNLTAGKGAAVGVASDGRLEKYGYDVNLRRIAAHPDHGYAFDDCVIPSFDEARQTCIRLHQTVPDLDLLSWDVAIDQYGVPVVVEVNTRRQDINLTQICNGPVLKPYIDTVLGRYEWLVVPGIGAIDRRADVAPEFAKH